MKSDGFVLPVIGQLVATDNVCSCIPTMLYAVMAGGENDLTRYSYLNDVHGHSQFLQSS